MQNDSSHIRSDGELVDAVRLGDREVFRLIMERHGPFVMAYLIRHSGSALAAEDLAQEVFLTAFQELGRLKKKDALRSWLLGISRNKVREYWRKGGREMPLSGDAVDRAVDGAPGPHERASRNEVTTVVTEMVNGMSPRYRPVLWMRLIEERSFSEISRLLNIKESTTRMRFKRGASMLRKALKKRGFEATGERDEDV